MLTFEKITKDNFDDAIKIKVTTEQKKIIAPVEYSLAESYVYSDYFIPFLICDGKKAVGFILFIIDKEEPLYYISRMMIDKNHQGCGYGKKTIELAINFLKEEGASKIELSHRTDNMMPSHLYQSFGFKYTGIIEDEEMMMALLI